MAELERQVAETASEVASLSAQVDIERAHVARLTPFEEAAHSLQLAQTELARVSVFEGRCASLSTENQELRVTKVDLSY